ncbi:MAG: hypothetical protein ACETV1_06140 [Candidatus Bathyarchaeia archaeon]
MSKRTFVFAVLALMVWSVIATAYAGYYYMQYRQLGDKLRGFQSLILEVNILINYGNGTKEWHNATFVPVGATVFNATLAIAEVDSTPYGEYVLINSINGVQGASDKGWIWWIWDHSTSQWKSTIEAANQHIVIDGDIIGWNYQNWASTSPPS